ncbi:MAG: hypothetical protein ACI94Y_001622 [Maribacter sp.]|jgi:uncharacterized protein (DUF1501 family)
MCDHYRKGTRLQEGNLHERDHRLWTRRDFISKSSLLAGASLFLSQLPIRAFAKSPLALDSNNKNILVLIQLKGGNDGLNTIIPYYDFGRYKSLRPKIHVSKSDSIQLNNDFGMHQAMTPLKSLWDKGMMKIINNVGYPNPNMSHFRSKDIWTTSSDSHKMESTGWLGRFLENEKSTNGIPPAIEIGGESNLSFQSKIGQLSLNVENPKHLYKIAQSGEHFERLAHSSKYNKELDFIRSVCNSTKQYAKSIKEADNRGKVEADYKGNSLSKQLKQVAKLIKGNLGSRVYMVTLDGFDTHASQSWKHENLLKELSEGIHSFYNDLSPTKLQNQVTTMTFSEFGRRIEENGSRGTDHGTAAPVMMFGGGLGESKILGTPPDFNHLDNDKNLIHSTDFRQIYSSVLQDWMGSNSKQSQQIIKGDFKRVKGLF